MRLQQLIQRATYVVALDADLGFVSYNTLARFVSWTDSEGILRPRRPLHLWINETQSPDRRTIELYAAKNHLVADLLQAIADGKRCFVTSNNKRLIDKLEAVVRARV